MNHLGFRAAALLRPSCRGLCLSSLRTEVSSCSARRAVHSGPRHTWRTLPHSPHRAGPFASQTSWRPASTHSGSSSPGTPPPGFRPQFKSRQEMYAARNRSLLMYTTAVIVLGVGVTYAAVPLYRMFCAATGFAGTPKVGMGKFEAERLVPVEDAKRIKVHFNADTSDALPWSFVPQQKFVSVLPGETSLAFYKAKNKSDKDIIGIATYNVTPDRIAPYFAKVECFCFEEQKLLAGEEVDMPLLFFIDRDVLDDPACRNLDDIVLSYTFFRARRNEQGHLEPDAPDDVVQASQGFSGYEHAPKAEVRSKNTTA
ncbi:cytochrome c oxidase assembly protein CtaG/Cox11-domain-containing protein [Dichomitus squalens]|uniref:Cytochrome c oxidase assembly protein CtaG/Cox11-domain-containing protein n=1 Tax=Dichomitus squalens TaxID=114155 RepID=A0A4Q9MHX8_9APHY|nr:cytochrome c oxidase assembly protein CtaG/Cox11-domain-containing protein [Dichomitus squalens]